MVSHIQKKSKILDLNSALELSEEETEIWSSNIKMQWNFVKASSWRSSYAKQDGKGTCVCSVSSSRTTFSMILYYTRQKIIIDIVSW